MRKQGFTLIELLVTIGVIGVLIGLLLPAISGARRSAREVVVLSNLRQASITFSNYALAYGGVMPFAPAGSTFVTAPPGASEGSSVTTGNIWDLSYYWPSLFHDIAPWHEHYNTWVVSDPRRNPDQPWDGWENGAFPGNGIPSFYYCRSLYARPALWSGRPVDDPGALLAPVKAAEVRYPSGKVFLYDGEAPLRAPEGDPPEKIAMAFVDGHAARHDRDDASEPVMPAGNDVIVATLHDTKDGAFGRDY